MNQENQNQEQNQQGQDNAGKTQKKFETVIANLVAVLGGEEHLKLKVKVAGSELSTIVSELFKEEQEEAAKKFKDDLKNILKKKAEYDAFIREEEKKFEKAKEVKQKEFVDSANKLFNNIENWGTVLQSYHQAAKATQVAVDGGNSTASPV